MHFVTISVFTKLRLQWFPGGSIFCSHKRDALIKRKRGDAKKVN